MADTGKSGGGLGSLALKIGIASAVGFGALATGLLASRRGRHLVKEVWQGRQRTPIEDRVLDRMWGDPVLGRRDLDVDEVADGTVALYGKVRSEQERRVALALAQQVNGVREVEDHLMVAPRDRERRARERLERR
jgi:hypothetical protein